MNVSDYSKEEKFSVIFSSLVRMENLEKGWDSYNADPPNEAALYNAGRILAYFVALDYWPSKVAPSVEGGVGFIFHHADKYADIECDNDGTVLYVYHTRDSDLIGRVVIDPKRAINEIKEFMES